MVFFIEGGQVLSQVQNDTSSYILKLVFVTSKFWRKPEVELRRLSRFPANMVMVFVLGVLY